MSERVKNLMDRMTLKQKIGQLLLRGDGFVIEKCEVQLEKVREGMVSAHPDMDDLEVINQIQKAAVEESELGIPIVFGIDVVHGYKTIFPIPLSETMSFEPKLAQETAAAAAREAAACGVKWTYAPMVDIARNPHWGRICEGAGEDPYIGAVFARARVKGFQGDDPSAPDRIAACPKHFAGYGFVEGGRDYNTVEMSEAKLYNVVLPPFRAAVEAGALSVMSAFHDVNGEPCTGSSWLLNDLLRKELGFKGMVVSDCYAIPELVVHGCAEDEKAACRSALLAGVDMDMASSVYRDKIAELIETGGLSMEVLDRAVERVLNFKEALGVFERPYADKALAEKVVLSKEHKELARKSAVRSVALLKHKYLPLKKDAKVALIGPMSDNKEELLGEWCCNGNADDCVTLYEALKKETEVIYAKGCDFSSDDVSGFKEAVNAAKQCDVIVAMLGQSREICGEGKSRANLEMTGVQTQLLQELKKTRKPIILILVSGRPIIINDVYELADDVLFSGALGTMGGFAYCDLLFGRYNPSAKLVFSMPRNNTSAETTYYSHKRTGRPFNPEIPWCSRWIDACVEPFLPFGFGLSYSKFTYSDLRIEKKQLSMDEILRCSVAVENAGGYDGEEVTQVYITDVTAKNTRPVKELKAFDKKMIKAGETEIFAFEIPVKCLGYYDRELNYCNEPGKYILSVGGNSKECICADFSVI